MEKFVEIEFEGNYNKVIAHLKEKIASTKMTSFSSETTKSMTRPSMSR
jgi:hypothetical protein